jgi:hypothetical protein
MFPLKDCHCAPYFWTHPNEDSHRFLQKMQVTSIDALPSQPAVSANAALQYDQFDPPAIWGWVKTLVPLVNPKIASKWMFIPLKMYL